MGNFNSQYFKDILDEAVSYGTRPSPRRRPRPSSVPENSSCKHTRLIATSSENFLFTPKCKILDCDPRSPTEGITRTPIEVLSVTPEQKTNFESEVQSTGISEGTPSITRISKRNAWEKDPRSPAFGNSFIRTPIQFTGADDLKYEAIEKKIPPNVVITSKRNEDLGEEESEQIMHDEEPEIGAVEPATEYVSQTTEEMVLQGTKHSNDITPVVVNDKKDELNNSKDLYDTPKNQDKMHHQVINKENSSSNQKTLSTPEFKAENAVKPKVRTPLGTLCANNSPLQILREKQSIRVNKSFPAGFTQSPHVVRTIDRK